MEEVNDLRPRRRMRMRMRRQLWGGQECIEIRTEIKKLKRKQWEKSFRLVRALQEEVLRSVKK